MHWDASICHVTERELSSLQLEVLAKGMNSSICVSLGAEHRAVYKEGGCDWSALGDRLMWKLFPGCLADTGRSR